MRHRTLVGLAALAMVFVGAQPAYAANQVDGSITAGTTVCTWANAQASANPPTTLTVFGSTVNATCNDGTAARLDNDPTVTFNDTNGTATADTVDVTVVQSGITCQYRLNGAVLQRQGTTRDYVGGPYTGNRISGSFFCPSTATIDQATLSFH